MSSALRRGRHQIAETRVIVTDTETRRLNTSAFEPFEKRSIMSTETIQSSAGTCAREVLDVVPSVMRVIRHELRKHGAMQASIPQFRTLVFLNGHMGASLSEVAEHIGLSLPSMSALVDGLVTRGLVIRRTHSEDRRRMTLALTERGRSAFRSAREATAKSLEEVLARLSAADRATVIQSMQVLRKLFTEVAA